MEVRDIPDDVLARLKARAAAGGSTLEQFIRAELLRLAAEPPEARRQTNAEIIARMLAEDRTGGPTRQETVAMIRRMRDAG